MSYHAGEGPSTASMYPPTQLPSYDDGLEHHGRAPSLPDKEAGDTFGSSIGDSHLQPRGLLRKDTLTPSDSASRYQWRDPDDSGDTEFDPRAAQRAGGDAAVAGQDYPYRRSMENSHAAAYDDRLGSHLRQGSMGAYSQASIPFRDRAAGMGYAEDEEDEHKQYALEPQTTDHEGKPILFSNELQDDWAGDDKRAAWDPEGGANGAGNRGFSNRWNKSRSIDEAVQKRRQGIGRQRWAPVSYVFTIAYLAVFAAELIKSASETGSAIQTKPTFNPMIGPSSSFLISFGARFVPCMRNIPVIPAATATLPCLDAVNNDSTFYQSNQLCTLANLCGLQNPAQPNQMWRLLSAMFLHAGILHILFNLIAQLTICVQMEKIVGSIFYLVVYVAGGIGGNLLGSNFGLIGSPSVGASGAIFAVLGLEMIDLIYNWQYEARAKTRLTLSIGLAIVSLALGLLPGIDNFAHIGGFAVGILGGLVVAPSVHPTKKHRLVIWALRVIGMVLLAAFMIGLGLNFVRSDDPSQACSWCRYLSCLRVFSQCKGTGASFGSTTGTTRRAVLEL